MQIRTVSPSTLKDCLSIADQELGQDYVSADSFIENGTYALCAVIENNVVGFATNKIMSREIFIDSYPKIAPHMSQHFRSSPQSGQVGIIASVATRSTHQRMGIGYALTDAVLQDLYRKRVSSIVMLGWSPYQHTHISHIAERLNIPLISVLHNYWYEDSLMKGYHCPVCGKPPCQCDAVLYTKLID